MRRRQVLALSCLSGPWWPAAAAGSFSVFPTQLRFDERISTGSLRLSNLGSSLGVFQVDPRVWTSEGVGESATELVINPTIVTVQPGKQQLLRIGLVRLPPANVERAFRIYLQQVEAERSLAASGTELLLRIGVPVFVAPFERQSLPLHVVLTRDGEQLQVLVSNPANHHQRLLNVRWRGGKAGDWTAVDTRPVYVLARAAVRFATALPSAVTEGELQIEHDAGTLSLALPGR